VLAAAAAAAPLHALRTALAVRSVGTSCTTGVCTQTAAIQTFLTELRSMPLFREVSAALPPGAGDADAHLPTQQQPETAAAASCCDHHAAQRPPAGSDGAPAVPPPGDEPAVSGTLAAERVSMLLELVPAEAWSGVPEPLRGELLALLDTSAHSGEPRLAAFSVCVFSAPAVLHPACPGCRPACALARAAHEHARRACGDAQCLATCFPLPPAVVAIEAEYLRAQFAELEALQQSEEQAQQAELQCSTVRRMDSEPQQGAGGADAAHV
jgi:hypothetical protein